MCLAVIAVDAHPRLALVLAANRDEYHARPAAPATWGRFGAVRAKGRPESELPPLGGQRAIPWGERGGTSGDVLAGRDLMAGGTWLAVRRDGRFALVTNVRQGKAQDPAARSRGELPLLALRPERTVDQALQDVEPERYNGFNLVAGDARGFAWMSNRAANVRRVANGVHGLSNALLDVPWPKVVRTQERLRQWLRGDGTSLEPLFEALGDRAQAPDALLPATGVTLAWERMLSAPFIQGERYGTRCSTVLTIDRGGHARFVERSFAPDGTPGHEVAIEFECG